MRYFIYCRKSSEGEERQVLSLASQQEALAKAFGGNSDIEIVGVFEEAKSAKTPGRPLFAQMLKRLEAGEADGIASWAPDRLARNSIDGGHIIYLLDRGVLRDLKFATYTFENNSQGKFMLGIMFNQSKYYSDALSENVKRGNATKVAMGWRPNRPPIGYLNCPKTRTIIPDPDLFPLVRRMFELLLSGNHSPRDITLIARDEWGLRTPKRKVRGGTPLSLSAVYKMFSNPFYKGHFLWDGLLHPGKHQPVLSASEFVRVQNILGRGDKPRSERHYFPFTGLIRCGSCGLMVTAETKRNDYNSLYTYYHCSRRGLGPRCQEPATTADGMEVAFADFLRSLFICPAIEAWVRDKLSTGQGDDSRSRETAEVALKATIAELTLQLQELRRLRLRRMIDDAQYVSEHNRLTQERDLLLEAGQTSHSVDRFELFAHAISFSKYAVDWFRDAEPATQRTIVQTVGSNFSMNAKKLNGEAVKPFQNSAKTAQIIQQCGVGEDVLTKTAVAKLGRALLNDIETVAESPGGQELLDTLKSLHRQFGVPVECDGSATRRRIGKK
jgi:site-specific DNA recombinase